ncbi:MAG TPA: nitroreductase family protein [Candidatus Acidoferrales bacterium]|nr:nitroreductase family protein [Candidatus Acidoferrales bacterium]
MDFFDVVKHRRSVRVFRRTAVAPQMLQRILEAANTAPSAGNLQAYEIYVIADDRTRSALARAAYDQLFLAGAPVLLVFCTHAARAMRYGKRGEELYTIQDATIACAFAMLAATALGLATVWVGAFDTDDVRSAIGAPLSTTPIAILPIGYAAEDPAFPGRRALDDLVHRKE